jgi:predicted extracellular nuclease
VSINLHNYFNGDGQGAGFPTSRGADTATEFSAQRARIGAALHVLKPQLVAVMELENDGFEAYSAAADFIALLEQESGGTWQVARPEQDNAGSDEITVGLFYRTDALQAIGAARTLTGPEFDRSRQPIAQVFQPLQGGEPLLMVVNHLKSKGSCPDDGPDADQNDGQSCWNLMRTTSAHKMSAWVKSLAGASKLENVIIMGDMNAYRNEDPIKAIRQAGFEELMDDQASPTFSYMYFGEAGTLDYAFISPALKQNISRSLIWHANSTMPANMTLPLPWMRFSDHDPVIVDVSIRH